MITPLADELRRRVPVKISTWPPTRKVIIGAGRQPDEGIHRPQGQGRGDPEPVLEPEPVMHRMMKKFGMADGTSR